MGLRLSSCSALRGHNKHRSELDMSVQSKTKRKNHLKANVVMRLFLQQTLAIRNLTKRIQELDQKLARAFVLLQSNQRIYRKGK